MASPPSQDDTPMMTDVVLDFSDLQDMMMNIVPVDSNIHTPVVVEGAVVAGNEMEFVEPKTELEIAEQGIQPPNKRGKKKSSVVWEHFTLESVGDDCRRACCKQCKKSYSYSKGSKVDGTSHLLRHIAKGSCSVFLANQERNNLGNSSSYKSGSPSSNLADTPLTKRRYRRKTAPAPLISFDADRCRNEFTKMIIRHDDFPLHIVEHPAFVAFVQNLQPGFGLMNFSSVQAELAATYQSQKNLIQEFIQTIPGRICLTLDMWSSCRTLGYVFLTGYFVDCKWKVHRKLLNVVTVPCPDSDTAFSQAVSECLNDWGIGVGTLLSVTINQSLSDAAVDHLRASLSVENPLVLGGQLVLGNCLAKSLSSIVQDAFASVQDTIKKVRDSVKYVKNSELNEGKFMGLKHKLQLASTKGLPAIDDLTKWNTTYEMLLAASELKEVFSCLDIADTNYKNAPSLEDWKKVETLCTYLKPLFETANLLTSPNLTTTNTFFHEAWKIQLELAHAAASDDDPLVRGLTSLMQEQFDKYWRSCCFVLAISVVMDPRFKMKLVEFSFSKIYGEENSASYVKIVAEGIHEVFRDYVTVKTEDYSQGRNLASLNGFGLTDFDVYMMETTSQQSKTELDQYLEESLLPRVHEFDVIGWWKFNRLKYPTLSKMARDILSIPVCTVAADSVFDTVPKQMDSYKSSLRPETLEALMCLRNWMKNDESGETNKH